MSDQIKERGLGFIPEMVRAILEGRKCVTRRVINPQPSPGITGPRYNPIVLHGKAGWEDGHGRRIPRPYHNGQTLWVREAFAETKSIHGATLVVYRDGSSQFVGKDAEGNKYAYGFGDPKHAPIERWTPSIHMPRWASRITLQATSVSIERIQDIREFEAKDEGFVGRTIWGSVEGEPERSEPKDYLSARDLFRLAWCEMHGDASWDENHYVWVINFMKM